MLFNKDFSFLIESPVKGSREEIWKHITQMKNVNAELWPYAKMTYPADKAELGKREVPVNETLFTSVILLLGFIPVDLHYLKFDRLEPGYAFYENSTTLTHRYWKHTRSIIENRTIVTEFGAPMTTGIDYSQAANGDINISFIQGITTELNTGKIGSCYWPGLRDSDSYSIQLLRNDSMLTTNPSGALQLRYGWRQ